LCRVGHHRLGIHQQYPTLCASATSLRARSRAIERNPVAAAWLTWRRRMTAFLLAGVGIHLLIDAPRPPRRHGEPRAFD